MIIVMKPICHNSIVTCQLKDFLNHGVTESSQAPTRESLETSDGFGSELIGLESSCSGDGDLVRFEGLEVDDKATGDAVDNGVEGLP